MYGHILVPVDGSAASRHVAVHAFELAAALGARVSVIHVVEDLAVPFVQYGMEPYVDLEAVSADVVEAHRDAAERLVADVAADAPEGLTVEASVIDAGGDRVGDVIARLADERGTDLIVMGTHGHRGLSKVLLGSVADHVVRTARVPVTLVRYHEHEDAADHPQHVP